MRRHGRDDLPGMPGLAMGFDMAYRGDDLDLRTLQGFAPQGRELQELFQAQPSGAALRTRPLYVDETVLACLNDAFELAAVHRASDLRLEHLLNAMTRVEAAAKIMDLNGVRVAALRRDTGALIASELAGYANGRTTPRTGSDVEEVLRGAADRAAARRQAVTIEDLLDLLAEPGRDYTGVQVLRRNWGGRPLREATAQVLPSFALPFAVDAPRERVRVQARPAAYEPARTDVQQAMTDQVQNNRIDGLERLVRQLSDELNAERKGMSAVFVDMQRELAATRDDSARYRGGLSDRLKSLELAVVQSGGQSTPQVIDRMAAIERGLDARFDDLARGWTALGERLQAVEFGVQQVRAQEPVVAVDMKPVERQLGDVARTLATLGDRLAMLERTGNRTPASNEPVLDRISQLERAVNNGLGEGARNWLAMGERLKAMEKAVATRPAETAQLAPVLERIDALQRTIAQRPAQAPVSFAPVLERIEVMERSLAQRAIAPQASLTPVMERIEALERSIRERVAQPATAVSLGPVLDRFVQLERVLEARSGDASRTIGHLADRIGRIEEGLATQRNALAEVANRFSTEVRAVTAQFGTDQGSVVERVQTLLGSFGRERTELVAQVTQPVSEVATRLERSTTQSIEGIRHAVTQIAMRITTLEGQIAGVDERLERTSGTRDGDLIELHDALVKIGGNQQTLATALDQWRLDTAGDLNVISTRVEQMEKVAERPAQMMQQLAAEVQSLHAMQLKREARKSRFRMWLFGTEDWFGDSWERRTEQKAQSIAQSTATAKAGTVPYLRR